MSVLKQFLKDPKGTGAVVPSSSTLSRRIVEQARVADKCCVVEFGSGTGVFTEEIGAHISDSCVFFSLEINPAFVKKTQERCPQATVYHASAADVQQYLQQHGRTHCDAIISGLPWGIFDEDQQVQLLQAAYDALGPQGEFLTFSYLSGLLFPPGLRFRKLLKETFREVETSEVVWRNFPPAFVYRCRK